MDGRQEGPQLTGTDGPAPGVLRTPEARFDVVADFACAPHYVTVQVDGSAPVRLPLRGRRRRAGTRWLLCIGQPTWSYLYRRVIDALTGRGLRCVAPDNVGFGRSDKPVDPTTHTYRRHVAWMTAFVDALGLDAITLVVQDWGGPIGLGALAARPERFARVVATNTALHTCDPSLEARLAWANYATGDGRMVVEQSLARLRGVLCARAPELPRRASSSTVRWDRWTSTCAPPTTRPSPSRATPPACVR